MTLRNLKSFIERCPDAELDYDIVMGTRTGAETWKIEKLHPIFRVHSNDETKQIIFDTKPL